MMTPTQKQTLLKLKDKLAFKVWNIYSRECFLSELNPDPQFCLDTYPEFFDSIDEVLLCARYCKNYHNRNIRLSKKIDKIITDFEEPIFITLTFTDETLNKTSLVSRQNWGSGFSSLIKHSRE